MIAKSTAGTDLERNGLTAEARREVHESDDETIVCKLVVRDLRQRLG
ncbi:MAG: hypothetical protein LJE70_12780 [Chromatiaceae bacterium]|nr:hypothetical protein [Chromatiaceae bacterium]